MIIERKRLIKIMNFLKTCQFLFNIFEKEWKFFPIVRQWVKSWQERFCEFSKKILHIFITKYFMLMNEIIDRIPWCLNYRENWNLTGKVMWRQCLFKNWQSWNIMHSCLFKILDISSWRLITLAPVEQTHNIWVSTVWFLGVGNPFLRSNWWNSAVLMIPQFLPKLVNQIMDEL